MCYTWDRDAFLQCVLESVKSAKSGPVTRAEIQGRHQFQGWLRSSRLVSCSACNGSPPIHLLTPRQNVTRALSAGLAQLQVFGQDRSASPIIPDMMHQQTRQQQQGAATEDALNALLSATPHEIRALLQGMGVDPSCIAQFASMGPAGEAFLARLLVEAVASEPRPILHSKSRSRLNPPL